VATRSSTLTASSLQAMRNSFDDVFRLTKHGSRTMTMTSVKCNVKDVDRCIEVKYSIPASWSRIGERSRLKSAKTIKINTARYAAATAPRVCTENGEARPSNRGQTKTTITYICTTRDSCRPRREREKMKLYRNARRPRHTTRTLVPS
jgi:hypothetical protein